MRLSSSMCLNAIPLNACVQIHTLPPCISHTLCQLHLYCVQLCKHFSVSIPDVKWPTYLWCWSVYIIRPVKKLLCCSTMELPRWAGWLAGYYLYFQNYKVLNFFFFLKYRYLFRKFVHFRMMWFSNYCTCYNNSWFVEGNINFSRHVRTRVGQWRATQHFFWPCWLFSHCVRNLWTS